MLRHAWFLGVVGLAVTGCKPPEELDETTTLAETIPLLFQKFEEDDATLAGLIDALEQGLEDEGLDLESENLDDRAFTIEPLPHEGLGGDAKAPEGTDPANQTPVVLFGLSASDFDTSLAVALEPNQVCIESNSTVSYDRTYTTDEACFRDGSCPILRSTVELRKELSFIAAGWYDLFKDFHRFKTTDGRDAMIARGWSEEIFLGDSGNNSFDQTFTAEVYIQDGDKTKRMYAIWSEINIGLGPDAMRSLIRDSLQEGYENADAFAADDTAAYCPNDRNEEFVRE